MVTLSMGILQCNLFANVSTVAGKRHLNSSRSSSLGLWPPGSSGQLQRASTPAGQWADLGKYTQLFTATRSGTTVNANGFGQASASGLSLTFTPISLDRTGRQIPTRLSRNPEAGWLLGRKRSKEVALKFTPGPVSSLWPLQNSQLPRSSVESAAMAWSTVGRGIGQG